MKGILIQLTDAHNNVLGIYHTKEKELIENPGMLLSWYKEFIDSDLYKEEGITAFTKFVKEIGYKVKRAFLQTYSL